VQSYWQVTALHQRLQLMLELQKKSHLPLRVHQRLGSMLQELQCRSCWLKTGLVCSMLLVLLLLPLMVVVLLQTRQMQARQRCCSKLCRPQSRQTLAARPKLQAGGALLPAMLLPLFLLRCKTQI
jgi:hypothetical protein